MFKQQINGGSADCCETMMYDRPYSNLSTGEKVVAGTVGIAVLSKHYDVTAPVFVDNAESVTLQMPQLGQMIRLVAKDTSNFGGSDNFVAEIDEEAKF